ncbi:MAG: hypothetical protein C6Y20_13080 [Tagaea sp. CACIAM 22H2]|nr:hypothetical protein [Tagaea sp. CACIAM 22H2]
MTTPRKDLLPLFVGTGSGLFRTDGRGGHVRTLDAPIFGIAVAGRRIACATGARGIAVSADEGTSWNLGADLGYEAVSVAFDPANHDNLVAGARPAAIFASADGGGNWRLLKDFRDLPGTAHWEIPELDPTKKVTSVATGGGAAAWAVRFDPARPGRIVVGVEVGGLVITENGGRDWRITEVGDSPDPHDILLCPGDPDTIVVSTGYSRFTDKVGVFRYSPTGGVYVSHDAGRSFRNMWENPDDPQYTRLMCCDPRPPYAMTVCIRSSYVQPNNPSGERRADLRQSADGGRTWRSVASGTFASFSEEYSAVVPDPENAGDVYVSTEKGRLFRVDAAGREWRELPGFGERINCLAALGCDTAPMAIQAESKVSA